MASGFFGFTNCPDICPTTLGELAQLMDLLGPDAQKTQPLFISIDPERDRVETMAEYVSAFHPSIVGLTGTETEVTATAKSFKAFSRSCHRKLLRMATPWVTLPQYI